MLFASFHIAFCNGVYDKNKRKGEQIISRPVANTTLMDTKSCELSFSQGTNRRTSNELIGEQAVLEEKRVPNALLGPDFISVPLFQRNSLREYAACTEGFSEMTE